MKMKKTAVIISLITAALCLGGCSQNADAPADAALASTGAGVTEVVNKRDAAAELPAAVPSVPPGDRPNEIVISLEGEDAFINEAAEKYMELHDDVLITVKQIDSSGDPDRSKYAQIISTELISGKGADIYDASMLSYYRMADSNLLADLNEYIGEELKDSKYTQALFEAFLYKGKQYTVPLSYNFSGCEINAETAREYGVQLPKGNLSVKTLLLLSEQLPKDGSVLLFDEGGSGYMDEAGLAELLIQNSFNDLVDLEGGEANFEDGKFQEIIDAVKRISENGQLGSGAKKALITPYMLYTPLMTHKGTVDYKDMILITNAGGTAAFSSASFQPVLNVNSARKELAADFIKFLLSDEMQSLPSLLFNPVNKNAAEEISKLSYADLKSGGYLPEGFTEETMAANIEKFNELSGSLNILETKERFINNLLRDELRNVFDGESSANEAAAKLQSSVDLYLNE